MFASQRLIAAENTDTEKKLHFYETGKSCFGEVTAPPAAIKLHVVERLRYEQRRNKSRHVSTISMVVELLITPPAERTNHSNRLEKECLSLGVVVSFPKGPGIGALLKYL